MNFATVFRIHGTWVYLVQEQLGELDLETGLRPPLYRYERVRALIGTKNYGWQMHISLDESNIVLPKQADLVVVGDEAYRLTDVSFNHGVFIYHKDKVQGDELRSIVDRVPTKSGSETL
jgi:hypothetical protein